MNELIMPAPLPGSGIQGNHGVGEKIVALAIPTVKVECRRSGSSNDKPALFIHAEPTPNIGGAGCFPRILWPAVIADFARVRNRVKDPLAFAGSHVVRANVPRRGRPRTFSEMRAENDQVLIDCTWRC